MKKHKYQVRIIPPGDMPIFAIEREATSAKMALRWAKGLSLYDNAKYEVRRVGIPVKMPRPLTRKQIKLYFEPLQKALPELRDAMEQAEGL